MRKGRDTHTSLWKFKVVYSVRRFYKPTRNCSGCGWWSLGARSWKVEMRSPPGLWLYQASPIRRWQDCTCPNSRCISLAETSEGSFHRPELLHVTRMPFLTAHFMLGTRVVSSGVGYPLLHPCYLNGFLWVSNTVMPYQASPLSTARSTEGRMLVFFPEVSWLVTSNCIMCSSLNHCLGANKLGANSWQTR